MPIRRARLCKRLHGGKRTAARKWCTITRTTVVAIHYRRIADYLRSVFTGRELPNLIVGTVGGGTRRTASVK
jgi:hypothetical protein